MACLNMRKKPGRADFECFEDFESMSMRRNPEYQHDTAKDFDCTPVRRNPEYQHDTVKDFDCTPVRRNPEYQQGK